MKRFAGILSLTTFAGLLLFAATAQAGVYGGTIESVSAPSGRIVLKFLTSGKTRSFRVSAGTRVTLDGKPSSLERLKPRMKVTITTLSSGRVSRVSARKATATTPSKPTTPTTPDPVPTKPTPGSRPPRGSGNAPQAAGEWPQFRGPNRDNISTEIGLLESWPFSGPPLAWTARDLGAGYSTVSVADGRVFTMGMQGNAQTAIALELGTGEQLWATPCGPAYNQGRGDGPRSTPTFDEGRVYVLGGGGELACLDAESGRIRWQKNILRDFAASNINWGISESVLIDGEKLICTPGGRGATMVALNKRNGQVIWRAAVPGNPPAGYASPIVIEVGGVRQYVTFTSRSVIGIRADNGRPLWQDAGSANGTANCSTPLFYRDHVFSASGYGAGGALVRLASARGVTNSQQVYKTPDMKNHHGGMVIVDGYLYGSSDPGILTCLDLADGSVKWQDRSVGKASITCADGHLYVRSEAGPVALVEATPAGYREKSRFDQPDRSPRPSWPHPVVAAGELFLRDQDVLLCYDVKVK